VAAVVAAVVVVVVVVVVVDEDLLSLCFQAPSLRRVAFVRSAKLRELRELRREFRLRLAAQPVLQDQRRPVATSDLLDARVGRHLFDESRRRSNLQHLAFRRHSRLYSNKLPEALDRAIFRHPLQGHCLAAVPHAQRQQRHHTNADDGSEQRQVKTLDALEKSWANTT